MLTLEKIQAMLGDRNLREVSRKTGLHYNVVWRLASNPAANPTYETVKVMSDYLEGIE